jgi:hypothetical protein
MLSSATGIVCTMIFPPLLLITSFCWFRKELNLALARLLLQDNHVSSQKSSFMSSIDMTLTLHGFEDLHYKPILPDFINPDKIKSNFLKTISLA